MSPHVWAWVKGIVEFHDLAPRRTLEVGSFDVNGTIRDLFTGEYLATDARPGPGVDYVHDIEGPLIFAPAFDVVVCCEMLEHTPRPWLAALQMARHLNPGGWLILTTRNFGFPRHDFPTDYYRFSAEGLEALLRSNLFVDVDAMDDPVENGTFATARVV